MHGGIYMYHFSVGQYRKTKLHSFSIGAAVVQTNYSGYGWAFGLPENFGSGFSGFRNFGFPKMLPEIWLEKEEPENSGTRKFGYPKIRVRVRVYPNYPI